MRRRRPLILGALLLACTPSAPGDVPTPGEELSGGDTTVFDTTREAYGYSARNLGFDDRQEFLVGNNFFGDNWVIAPSSTETRDGLGPVYNALSCGSCHFKDGRGEPPSEGEEMLSMLVRLSVPGVDAHGGPSGDPIYGGQIQPRAIPGVAPEAVTRIRWSELPGAYADGSPFSLRSPTLEIVSLGYGPMADDVMMSVRVAPVVYGLGLLEAVTETDILAHADPEDADGDGISGRPNHVWSAEAGRTVIGRFGWKAQHATLLAFSGDAYRNEMGITNDLFPDEFASRKELAEVLADLSVDDLLESLVILFDRVDHASLLARAPRKPSRIR